MVKGVLLWWWSQQGRRWWRWSGASSGVGCRAMVGGGDGGDGDGGCGGGGGGGDGGSTGGFEALMPLVQSIFFN